MSIVITAGMKLTPARLNALAPRYARKTANQTVNNSTTLVNDNHLFLPVLASAVYQMDLRLRYSTGAVPDLKFGFTFPTGLTITYGAHAVGAAASVWTIFDLTQASLPVVEGGFLTVHATGQVVVSSSPGTLQLQWAQNTANASDTIVQAGSWLMLQQME